MRKTDRLCAFCGHGREVEQYCGKLHGHRKKLFAHHKCMQYSSGLTQYMYENFGGFDVKEVQDEIRRGRQLVCSWCGKNMKDGKWRTSATAGCTLGRCQKTFHFLCARRHASTSRRRTRTKKGAEVDLYRVFCSQSHKAMHTSTEQGKREYSCSETDEEFNVASSQFYKKRASFESDDGDSGDIKRENYMRDVDCDMSKSAGESKKRDSDNDDVWESGRGLEQSLQKSVKKEGCVRMSRIPRDPMGCVILLHSLDASTHSNSNVPPKKDYSIVTSWKDRGSVTSDRLSSIASKNSGHRKRTHSHHHGPTQSENKVFLKSSSQSARDSTKESAKGLTACAVSSGNRSVRGADRKKKASKTFFSQYGDSACISKSGPSSSSKAESRARRGKRFQQTSLPSGHETSNSSNDFDSTFSVPFLHSQKPRKTFPRYRRISQIESDSEQSTDSRKIVSTISDISINTMTSDIETPSVDSSTTELLSDTTLSYCPTVNPSTSDATLEDAVSSVCMEIVSSTESDEELKLPAEAMCGKSKRVTTRIRLKLHYGSRGRVESLGEKTTLARTCLPERQPGKHTNVTATVRSAASSQHLLMGNLDEGMPNCRDQVQSVKVAEGQGSSSDAQGEEVPAQSAYRNHHTQDMTTSRQSMATSWQARSIQNIARSGQATSRQDLLTSQQVLSRQGTATLQQDKATSGQATLRQDTVTSKQGIAASGHYNDDSECGDQNRQVDSTKEVSNTASSSATASRNTTWKPAFDNSSTQPFQPSSSQPDTDNTGSQYKSLNQQDGDAEASSDPDVNQTRQDGDFSMLNPLSNTSRTRRQLQCVCDRKVCSHTVGVTVETGCSAGPCLKRKQCPGQREMTGQGEEEWVDTGDGALSDLYTDCVLVIPAHRQHFERVAFDVQRDVSEQLGVEEKNLYVWTAVSPVLLPSSCMLYYFTDIVDALREQNWHRLRLLLTDKDTLKTTHDAQYLPRMHHCKTLLSPAQKQAEVATLVQTIVQGLAAASDQLGGLVGLFMSTLGANYLSLIVNHVSDKNLILRTTLHQRTRMFRWREGEVVFASFSAMQQNSVQASSLQECNILRKWFTSQFPQVSRVVVLPEEELLLNKDPACSNDSNCFAQLKARMEECRLSSTSRNPDNNLPVIVFIRRMDQNIVHFEHYLQACLRKFSTDFEKSRVTCLFHIDNLTVRQFSHIDLGRAEHCMTLRTAFDPSEKPVRFLIADLERFQNPDA